MSLKEVVVPQKYKNYVKEKLSIIDGIVSKHSKGYNWSLKDFILDRKELGKGQFGKVYLAEEKQTNLLFALKVMSKEHLIENLHRDQAVAEINIHSGLEHPNIVQFYTYFHDHHNIYILIEFVPGGDLFTALRKRTEKKFSEHLSAKYVFQISEALDYCHKRKIIHRDVKPENLLLTLNGDVKLIDFSWSFCLSSSKPTKVCGTIDYLAPEMIKKLPYSYKVDNWSLGVLCYEFLVGNPPFEMKTEIETYKKIVNAIISFPPSITSLARHLITNLLQKEEDKRLSLKEVKNHPWIVKHVKKVNVGESKF